MVTMGMPSQRFSSAHRFTSSLGRVAVEPPLPANVDSSKRIRLTRGARVNARRRRILLLGGIATIAFIFAIVALVHGTLIFDPATLFWRIFGVQIRRPHSTFIGPNGLGVETKSSESFTELLGQISSLTAYKRPECALSDRHVTRYKQLTKSRDTLLISLDLRNSIQVLPALIAELTTTAVAVGPNKVHFSIYENGSTDETPQLLALFCRTLHSIGSTYTVISEGQNATEEFSAGNRIRLMAEYRNRALKPIWDNRISKAMGGFDHVVFINDVILCAADILEIIYQRKSLNAIMTTGMDYQYLTIPAFEEQGYPLLFYDVWVARDMLGLPAYNISLGGNWKLPSPPFPLNRDAHARYDSLLPFQVFSAWNGLTAIDPKVFRPPYNIKFRAQDNGDAQSECYLFCVDLWKANLGRIAIVPRARVGYTLKEHTAARMDRNTTAFAHKWARDVLKEREKIDWKAWPPKLVAIYDYAYWDKVRWTPPW